MAAKTKGVGEPTYQGAARRSRWRRAKGAIDKMLADAGATILVQPTYGPAWLSDPVYGDQYNGPSSSELPAISGYPQSDRADGAGARAAGRDVVHRAGV